MANDDDEGGSVPHALFLGEICLVVSVVLFFRLANCESPDHECGGRRVAFFVLGLPLFVAGTFFALASFLSARASCLTVLALFFGLALVAALLASA